MVYWPPLWPHHLLRPFLLTVQGTIHCQHGPTTGLIWSLQCEEEATGVSEKLLEQVLGVHNKGLNPWRAPDAQRLQVGSHGMTIQWLGNQESNSDVCWDTTSVCHSHQYGGSSIREAQQYCSRRWSKCLCAPLITSRSKNPPISAFPPWMNKHLEERDKGRPCGRLHSDAQVKLSGNETPNSYSESIVCVLSYCVASLRNARNAY